MRNYLRQLTVTRIYVMYDQIFGRSFSRYEQTKIGQLALFGCVVIALSICTISKPQFHVQSIPAVNLQLSSSASLQDMAIAKDTVTSEPLQLSTSACSEDMGIVNTTVPHTLELKTKEIKPICSLSEPISDHCEIKGDIRVHPNSSTIFIDSNQFGISTENGTSWVIRPYARKGNEEAMVSVKKWTIKAVQSHENSLSCTQSRSIPAVLFSLGGYSGNHFHDFTDIVIPLFSTSRKFDGEVHFLATNYKGWWILKFSGILDKLSRHKVIDIDKEEGTRCYRTMIVGLKTHKELGIDTSESREGFSMTDFIHFLRSTYSLRRKTAIKMKTGGTERPRLMIISRKKSKSRILMNEGEVVKMAQSLGYEVILAYASLSTNLSKFAELVNSCDVLMGVHGAGLTNMVFLPDNAIVIQIVPLGIDELAMHYFEEPAMDMEIRYLRYKIKVTESSLIQKYSLNHEVIRDSFSLHKKGWDVFNKVYLEEQNVKLDVHRFGGTLLKAIKLLHHY